MTCGAPWRGGASTRAACSAVRPAQPGTGRPRFFAPFLIRNSSTGRCGHARVQNESRARAAGTGVFFFVSLFRREPCRARTAFCTFSRFSTSFRSSGSAGRWQAWGRLGLGIRVGWKRRGRRWLGPQRQRLGEVCWSAGVGRKVR